MNILTKLAEYPPETLLDEEALAAALGVSVRSIRNLVDRHELPRAINLCGKRWRTGTVCEFLKARADQVIREAQAEKAHEAQLLGEIPAVPRRRAR